VTRAGGASRSGSKAPVMGLLLALAAGGVPALLLAIAAARGGMSNPWILPLAVLALCANTIIIVMDLRYGLALFILAAGLSPKLPGFYNNLRVEDFVFLVVFGVWLARGIQAGRLPTVRSPIVLPFVTLTLVSAGATIYGFVLGGVSDGVYGLFLQLKRVEYFLIFWVVATTVRSEGWLRLLTLVFVASGALAACYGLLHQTDEGVTDAEQRVMGPEGEHYNTLSGYLILCIGAGLAAIPSFRSLPRNLLIASVTVSVLGLLFSFSREGYIMLVGSLLVFGLTRHRWILALAAVALAAAFFVSEPIRENVHETIQQIQEAPTGDPGANSLTARWQGWQYRWHTKFSQQPLLGNGVGSVPLSVDNEYLLRLCEVGLLGFAVFLWWLVAIGRQIRRLLQKGEPLTRMLALGLGAGFVGMLIQGLVAASFNTIRTMEPFWFLLGLVSAAVVIQRQTTPAPEPADVEPPVADAEPGR
jgi:general stress protein CsbA